MKLHLVPIGLYAIVWLTGATTRAAEPRISEEVFVVSPVDSNADGKGDRIRTRIDRPSTSSKVPVIYELSPYGSINNSAQNHGVDVDVLPQDRDAAIADWSLRTRTSPTKRAFSALDADQIVERGYASVKADSIGTGGSEGCPTVGDDSETLAGKAVIDWLNGRARAYYSNGKEAIATWATGAVGMTGVSYLGTLPNMIATTGVDGLKAIVPIAAISSWYNYYRSNGLVVGPGGYIGEDADVLGEFIARRGRCARELQALTRDMGREHGDFTSFWQARDYVSKASQTRAAVFIIHGQSDWNVRQRHATDWWEALEGIVPRRMWLHSGGHGSATRSDTTKQIFDWFDRYVKGIENGVETRPAVEVQDGSGSWTTQAAWPLETAVQSSFFFHSDRSLGSKPQAVASEVKIIDKGKSLRLTDLIKNPDTASSSRAIFLSALFKERRTLTGTSKIHLALSVLNRRAANITVAIVDYDASGRGTIVTRGWADPQNHENLESGEVLRPGQRYKVSFDIEPKQYTIPAGHRVGIVLASTDYDYTIRPASGTEVSFELGSDSFAELSFADSP